ncbi:hypothetical protein AKO1_004169 [Acrasis kona]|uniref:Env n=1 Tax=Acrasis kona TaxID=1008807 RepID=A0AAW2ZDI1_9EUKA
MNRNSKSDRTQRISNSICCLFPRFDSVAVKDTVASTHNNPDDENVVLSVLEKIVNLIEEEDRAVQYLTIDHGKMMEMYSNACQSPRQLSRDIYTGLNTPKSPILTMSPRCFPRRCSESPSPRSPITISSRNTTSPFQSPRMSPVVQNVSSSPYSSPLPNSENIMCHRRMSFAEGITRAPPAQPEASVDYDSDVEVVTDSFDAYDSYISDS